jgi:hypothetical protein
MLAHIAHAIVQGLRAARSSASPFDVQSSMLDVRCSSSIETEHRTSNIQHPTSNESRPPLPAIPLTPLNPLSRTLEPLLAANGIAYAHFPSLGGHRVPREDSVNGGWRNEAFRGYADHMRTQEFVQGIEALLEFAEKYLVAAMCAESQWRDCHRQLLADALVARAVEVRHIMSEGDAMTHQLPSFARVKDTVVEYPALF